MNQHFDCGVARSMNVLGGKWKLNILWVIARKEKIRFNQLKREVLGITNVMLTRSLDDLIEVGMISKKDFKTIPPHVEYSLTEKGKSLIPVMKELDTWGRKNL
jgi:DNA-binding HxlR family transcriptional regulator